MEKMLGDESFTLALRVTVHGTDNYGHPRARCTQQEWEDLIADVTNALGRTINELVNSDSGPTYELQLAWDDRRLD